MDEYMGMVKIFTGNFAPRESVNTVISNMPAHNHLATSTLTLNASNAAATVGTPVAGNALGAGKDVNTDPAFMYTASATNIPLSGGSVATAINGGNLPISIMQTHTCN